MGEDVLDQEDTVSLDELREMEDDTFSVEDVGICGTTPTDNFLRQQGRTSFITQ